jgi:outer membrane protein OmpA-like peptidoglycan-associated protein
MKSARWGLLLLLLSRLSLSLFGADTFLLQAENPFPIGGFGFALQAEGGAETGSIPDEFLSAGASLDLLRFVSLRGSLTAGYFHSQRELRLASVDASIRLRLWQDERSELQAYVEGLAFLGDPISAEYSGNLPGILYVLSPRAEGGYDALFGLIGAFAPSPVGPALCGGLDFAFTRGRDGFAEFSTISAGRRLRASISPSYRLDPAWSVTLQNRVVYWFDRGFLYELLPQAQWDPCPGLSLSAGLGIPAIGGESWRFLAGLRWAPRQKANEPPPPSSLQVIRELGGTRIRVYFQFQGDRAELLEPKNQQYGKQNRALLSELVSYLARYPEYDIVVEGHTNRARFELSFQAEQRDEMLPLAEGRAASVVQALTAAGISSRRLSAKAIGGLKPLADFRDEANCWKNRRVEIVLKKGVAQSKKGKSE